MSSSSFLAFRSVGRCLISASSSRPGWFASQRLCSSKPENKIIEDVEGKPVNDPMAAAFFSPSVQMCLARLTGLDHSRVFRVARRGQEIKPPTYVFMTDEELLEARKAADQRAKRKWLQMPPVMSPRSHSPRILETDPGIQGYDSAKYVFTDVTFGVHDRARFIVVRQPDGTLREADGEERDRLNQTYFPKEGRKIKIPPLFTDPEVLVEVLQKGGDRYIYILDRNCVQFEPDHPLYVKTSEAVFKAIDEKRDYDILKSSRHYGPMIFHFVWNKICDNFIAFQLSKQNFEDAVEAVKLYGMLHPTSKTSVHLSGSSESSSSDSSSSDEDESSFNAGIDLLRIYIKNDSLQDTKLNIGLEAMLEQRANQVAYRSGISEAHGAKK